MRHKDYECWLESRDGVRVQEQPVPLVRRLSDASRHARTSVLMTAHEQVSTTTYDINVVFPWLIDLCVTGVTVLGALASTAVGRSYRHRPARHLENTCMGRPHLER